MARHSVLVNTRYNVRQNTRKRGNQPDMKKDWFDRLVDAIKGDGRDLKAISLAARCGPNYVQQMIKNGKRPGVDRFLAILEALGSASAFHVLTGYEFTAEDEEFFRAVANLDPDLKKDAYGFLLKLQATSSKKELLPGPQD